MSETNNTKKTEKKDRKTLGDRYNALKHKVMANKAGRVTVRVLKGVIYGAGVTAGYIIGKKTVKPTVVYIEKTEEPEEAPAEEEKEETETEA